MKPVAPALDPARLERDVPLAEVLAMAGADGNALEGFVFSGEMLPAAVLEGVEFRGCLFTGCRLVGARLDKVYFRDCVLRNCDFSGAHAMDATLRRCTLTGCKLSGANFSGSVWEDVRVEDCVCERFVLCEGVVRGVLFAACRLPEAELSGWKAKGAFAFERCNLRGANFTHTALRGQDLTTCETEGVVLAGPELHGARVTALQACELARLLGVEIV